MLMFQLVKRNDVTRKNPEEQGLLFETIADISILKGNLSQLSVNLS